VAVAQGARQVSVRGEAGLDISALSGDSRVRVEPGEAASFKQLGVSGLRLELPAQGQSLTFSSSVRIRNSGPGLLALRVEQQPERRFRGDLEIASQAGSMRVINVLDVEEYLPGALAVEMGGDSPIEALKAQAVASRTTALRWRNRHGALGFDLCSTEHCQVYAGADLESPAAIQAAEATAGEVLMYDGQLAQTPFFAICGGHTENNEDVWPGQALPYLRGRPDIPDKDLPRQRPAGIDEWVNSYPRANCLISTPGAVRYFRWVRVVSQEQLQKSLAPIAEVGEIMSIAPLERGAGGRIKRLEVLGAKAKTVLGPELVIRTALGKLPSAAFAVQAYGEDGRPPVVFVFRGAGLGHGVGMCQMGAVGLAQSGLDYKEILGRYYPGCEVVKIR
jgi:SpoIID/LytB domain protein